MGPSFKPERVRLPSPDGQVGRGGGQDDTHSCPGLSEVARAALTAPPPPPRSSASNRIIGAKDHASIQMNVAEVSRAEATGPSRPVESPQGGLSQVGVA